MLLKNENQIIRVLKSHGDKALVIDCIKRTMPKWVDDNSLPNYDDCSEDELKLLLSICQSVLDAYRSAQGKVIETK